MLQRRLPDPSGELVRVVFQHFPELGRVPSVPRGRIEKRANIAKRGRERLFRQTLWVLGKRLVQSGHQGLLAVPRGRVEK